MKRFINELTSTTPFINSDFHDILQEQHLIAYRAYLEGLNDVVNQSSGSDRGIIIKGCEITSTPTFDGLNLKYTYNMDFTDSLVYFDGNFYTPKQDLIDTPQVPITGTNIGNEYGVFYIVPLTNTETRVFKSGLTQSFFTDYTFEVVNSTTAPTTAYIKFSFGGTSRRLSRLLRYNSANAGDIYTSYDSIYWTTITPFQIWRDFDNNGKGRNEMQGFQLSYSSSGPSLGGRFPVGYGPTYATAPQSAGLFGYNYGLPGNIGGTISLTFSSSQLPTHNHSADPVFGSTKDLTSTGSSILSFALDHAHPIYAQSVFGIFDTNPANYESPVDYDQDFRPVGIAMGVKTPNPSQTQKFLTRKIPLTVDYPFSRVSSGQRQAGSPPPTPNPVVPGVQAAPGEPPENDHINAKEQVWNDENDPLKSVIDINLDIDVTPGGNNSRWEIGKVDILQHYHRITTTGQDLPHENRPPYQVVLYYYKL